MPRTKADAAIKPSNVSVQVDWDIDKAREFAAGLLEDVNDHAVAAALWALMYGDVDLACDNLRLEQDLAEAGELTPALAKRQEALLDRWRDLRARVG